MPSPQTAIFRVGTAHHHYLEYKLAGDAGAWRSALGAALDGARPTGAAAVVAFSRRTWSALAPHEVPARLADFAALDGPRGHRMPATQSDVFVWLQADRIDHCTDGALAIHAALKATATLAFEERGYQYHRSRDLTGFEDGTANPKGTLRLAAALVPDGETGAGGSYVLAQQWVTDTAKFSALPLAEQEAVIGRSKAESIELEGDAMPPDSHVARTDVEVAGVAQKIWRRSAPFGGAQRHGLYFLAFACDPGRFDIQLRRMLGLAPDGRHDRLLEFSTPMTGSYWFAPSEPALAKALGLP
jgi:putative iron-dependent peroxidase